MKIKELVGALERFAPLPLQDGFDNAGLQIGLTDVEATGALLCLDVTENVLDEAIALGYNFVLSHHPLIFKGYKSITGKDYVERCILKAIKNDLVIYSAHTNLDNVIGGVNHKIAEKIGLKNVRFLVEKEGLFLHLVTFVPVDYQAKVEQALFNAGCGEVDNYDSCSYTVTGESTFRAREGAHPFCGEVGKIHRETEVRIGTLVPISSKERAISALLEAHPYEKPIYNFYALKDGLGQAGSGIVGELEEAMTEMEFLALVKRTFGTGCIKHNEPSGRLIKKIALCGGAGAFLLPQAIASGADAFMTSEIRYHEYFGQENNLLMVEIGHYESEQYTQDIFQEKLTDLFPTLAIKQTKVNTNPIKYY